MLGESSPRMSEWLCLTEPLYWPVSPASLETLIPCWPLVAAPPERWACTETYTLPSAAGRQCREPWLSFSNGGMQSTVVLTQLQDKCAIRACSVLKSHLKSFPYSFKLAIDSFYKMPVIL